MDRGASAANYRRSGVQRAAKNLESGIKADKAQRLAGNGIPYKKLTAES